MNLLALGLLAGLSAGPAPAQADTFRVDPSHAYVGFSVRHLAVARVRGTFDDVKGTLIYDPQDLGRSSVEIRIATASLNTRNERRDTDVRDNFLEAAQHPEITFRSTRVEKAADGWLAHGELTIHGVTRPVTLPFTLAGPIDAPGNIIRLGVSGGLHIDRRDFGITLTRLAERTGALVVGHEVEIDFDVEFGRRATAAAGAT